MLHGFLNASFPKQTNKKLYNVVLITKRIKLKEIKKSSKKNEHALIKNTSVCFSNLNINFLRFFAFSFGILLGTNKKKDPKIKS